MPKKKEESFTFKSKNIPTDPGCYLFYGEADDLLYVGKAKHLRKRVSSYFQKQDHSNRISVMIKKIRRIETRVVNSEIESLILENNLIKQYMPRFNVKLRDDKNFLYIRLTKEDFPKLELVRRMQKDGSTYIGPKTSTKCLRETIRFCQKFFGARMVKPGQDYYLNLVSDETITQEAYQAKMQAMKKFLRGQTSEVLKELQTKMMTFAQDKNFEAAAKTRDLIQSIQGSTQKQVVVFTDMIHRDFVHFVRDEHKAYFVRMSFAEGQYREQNEVALEAEPFESDESVLEQFLLQFYEKVSDLPKEIILPLELENTESIERLLSSSNLIRGSSELPPLDYPIKSDNDNKIVKLKTAQKGDKAKALRIAKLNAEKFRDSQHLEAMSHEENFAKALPALSEALNLKNPPRRIECYDISHFSGQGTVASMVVFVDGKPAKNQYRRFHIKSLPEGKIDDFAAMNEVLERRFGRINPSPQPPSFPKKEGGASSSLSKEGAQGGEITMQPVKTKAELKTYHEIREKEIFHRYHGPDFEYDDDHPDEKKKNNHPFIFRLQSTGVNPGAKKSQSEIIGTARLDHKTETRLALRLFAIKEPLQLQGYGTKALKIIEAYALENGFKSIVCNANPQSVGFYEKQDWSKDFWKGDSQWEDSVAMGKKITKPKEKWESPDLIVIDGGKGQLGAVMKLFERKNLGTKELKNSQVQKFSSFNIPADFDPQTQIIALAKKEEQIFRPGNKDPLELSFDNPGLKLLQRLRDEAHRFAISFNRAVRKKTGFTSALDEVPGIGSTTKKKLMQTFETVRNIRQANDEALLKILNPKQLASLRRHL